MSGFFATVKTEEVIRHRGDSRDDNGQYLNAADAPLEALAVAPGGGSEYSDRGRDGENVACTVYFRSGTDIVNGDELTVRGERFDVVVNDWRSPWTNFGGLEVLCKRGQG